MKLAIDQYRLSFIEFEFNPAHSSIEIHFEKFNSKLEYDGAVFQTMATFVTKILLEIIAAMTEINRADLILSRPKLKNNNEKEKTAISYSFSFITNNGPQNTWKSISFALLLRERHFYRSIADDCVDVYITLSDEWDYSNYVPDCFSEEATQFLSNMKSYLAEKVCEIINFEPETNAKKIIFAEPCYQKESMPGTGADCFELKGVIAE